MTTNQLSLLPFYEGWRSYNQRLVAAIAPLTGKQLALRATPRHWTVRMYVTHIVASRAWWFHVRMGEGGDDITPYELWALDVCEAEVDPLHTAAELVAGLEKTWAMIEAALTRMTPADLGKLFPALNEAEREYHASLLEPALQPYAQMWLAAEREAGGVKPSRTCQWIIWDTLEHDIHHGSEISTTLGVHGLPPVEMS